jgi:hypothetical protein
VQNWRRECQKELDQVVDLEGGEVQALSNLDVITAAVDSEIIFTKTRSRPLSATLLQTTDLST